MAKRTKVGIGLDIGSRSIQLAVLRPKKNGVEVQKVVTKELPHDAVVDNLLMDSQAVCDKIGELLQENRLKGKEAALSVSGRRVMIKKIATDEMSDDELAGTIAYEARSNLPFDTSEVTLDYARLPEEVDTGRMEVLLVAAKNEMVFDSVEPLYWAGGKATLLEAEPFALQAALAEAGYFEDQAVVAAIKVGFQSTDVTLFKNGQYESNRNLNVGGKTYIEGLIRELGIPFERAASLLASGDRSAEEQAAVDTVTQRVGEKLAEQVERGFPESFGMSAESPVSCIVLCGDGARLPMLEAELKRKFETTISVANPFRQFDLTPQIENEIDKRRTDYTAAVGLALRALGDRHEGFNLLFAPDKPSYKKASYAGLRTVVPVVAGAAILLMILVTYIAQQQTLSGLKSKLDSVRKETDLYRDKIAMVEDLTKKRADISARIDVISELDRTRFARIRELQLISDALPELTWLTGVEEGTAPRGPCVNVTGMTSSNLKVSQFMTSLLKSPEVRGVDLLVSEQTQIGETGVTRFTLQVVMPGLGITTPPPGAAPAKPGARKPAPKPANK